MARKDWRYISFLIVVPLLIGLTTFRGYGESTDESHLYTYSDYSLRAYQGAFHLNFDPDLGKGNFRFYGPAFLMGANLFTQLANTVIQTDLPRSDYWHLAYFLSFQLCALGLYFLARRWLSDLASFSTSLLFLFQPLLWGHAFINPKDIPFMSLCLISVLAGLAMQEKLFPVTEPWDLPKISVLRQAWHQAEPPYRSRILRFLLLMIVVLAILTVGENWITKLVSSFAAWLYALEPGNLIANLFSFFAKNYQQTPASYYIPKGVKFIDLVLSASAVLFLFRILMDLWAVFIKTPLCGTNIPILKSFKDTLHYAGNPLVLYAGIILGLTISVRILGPFPGLVVMLVALYRAKSKAIPAFTAYFLIALVVMYLAWPYLWQDPIGHFKTALVYMMDFPWNGKILFNGNYYISDQLPIEYVPLLFGVQFTEPVVFLFLFGLYVFFDQIKKQNIRVDFVMVVLLWGLIPFVAFTILRPSLYDNTRQLLFISPPLFLIAGLAVEKLFQNLRRTYISIGVLTILLLPGVYSIIHLHPYQYTYYNSFVGGLQGSYGRFESDYWATSFREAIEYLNRTAPENSRVIFYGPGDVDNISRFARSDLIISPADSTDDTGNDHPYVIVSTRNERHLKNFTEWTTVYVIQRDTNVFALVKQKP